MKLRLITILGTVALLAVGALSESVTKRTDARTFGLFSELGSKATASAEAPLLDTLDAHCFCRVTANGQEVAKPSKGGFIQGLQKEGCKNYCRGLWDSGQAQRITWAKLLPITNTCNITVAMAAAIGTASYEGVRGPEVEHLGTLTTNCTCPPGQTLSNSIGGHKYCLIPPSLAYVAGVPDQVSSGGYVWNNSNFYKSSGAANCVTFCQ